MQKKYWAILAVALCIVALGVTVWCVFGGIQTVLPDAPAVQEEQAEPVPELPEDINPPIDEYGNPLDMSGVPVGDDNVVVDPWFEAPIEKPEENSESPSDSESISNDPDLAVSDEGWTGIY